MTSELWEIALQCWAVTPADRPDMTTVLAYLLTKQASSFDLEYIKDIPVTLQRSKYAREIIRSMHGERARVLAEDIQTVNAAF
jgi:hypothetical protein